MPKSEQPNVPGADLYAPAQDLAVRPQDLKQKRRLTLDAISASRLKEAVVQVRSELTTVKMTSAFNAGEKVDCAAVEVWDAIRKGEWLLICNTVLAQALQRAGSPLTGRWFAVRVGDIVAGKTYRKTEVVELELVK